MGGTAFGCAIGLVYYGVMSRHHTGEDPLRDNERTAESRHEKTRAEQNTVATVKQMAMTTVAQKREARQERPVAQGDN